MTEHLPTEPPPDTSWLEMTSSRARPSGYVHRPSREKRHECPLPAEWEDGAVWRCPEGHLWVIGEACECRGRFERHSGRGVHTVGLAYWPASWWQRRRHGGKRARLDMANGNRRERFMAPGSWSPPTDYDG